MTLVPESAVRNSTLMRTATRVRAAAADARTVPWVQRREQEGPSTEEAVSEAQADTTEQADRASTGEGAAPAEMGATSSYLRGSSIYPLFAVMGRLVRESWLYRWLTAEPEPEVIVIDLRETIFVGPIIELIDSTVQVAERELLPAAPDATLTRLVNWVRVRTAARPIRVASIVVAAFVNLWLLLILGGGGDPLQPITFVLLAMLLLAVRGFRSSSSLAELRSTTWYQWTTSVLIAIFEPPEPPEANSPASGASGDSEASTAEEAPENSSDSEPD